MGSFYREPYREPLWGASIEGLNREPLREALLRVSISSLYKESIYGVSIEGFYKGAL
jgi:hypothetical protein